MTVSKLMYLNLFRHSTALPVTTKMPINTFFTLMSQDGREEIRSE